MNIVCNLGDKYDNLLKCVVSIILGYYVLVYIIRSVLIMYIVLNILCIICI